MENNLKKINGRRPQEKMEANPPMEDNLKTKIWKMTPKKRKMEDDLKQNLQKSTIIGCEIIVN